MGLTENLVGREVEKRAKTILHTLSKLWKEPFSCYIGGSSLTGGPINDVDLFPAEIAIPTPRAKVTFQSANATTYAAHWSLQVCSYKKPSLKDLIDSFDYTHAQVGAHVTFVDNNVIDVYFTEAFVAAQASKTSWFVGSEYPLSSLLRAGKYYKQDTIQRRFYLRAVINALVATVERGFTSYDDFKDQIEAVDLGLLNDEQEEVGHAGLTKLYELLRKKGT